MTTAYAILEVTTGICLEQVSSFIKDLGTQLQILSRWMNVYSYLRIKGKFFNTMLICVHAPMEDKDETEKNSFYDNLDRIYQKVAKRDIKIIMGDMNAKVGKSPRFIT
jgi:hypothetical protein